VDPPQLGILAADRHRLDRPDELVDGGRGRALQRAEHLAQALERLALDEIAGLLDDDGAAPEPPQREDAVQPLHVGRRVQAVAGARPAGRNERADLIVVVQRADRQPGRADRVADLSGALRSRHRSRPTPSRGVSLKAVRTTRCTGMDSLARGETPR
jgi:hypothetical protein